MIITKKKLDKILYKHSRWLDDENEGKRAVLHGADLAGAYLAGANLTGANLTGANLTGADLAGANLTGANLTGADLAGANLTDANLTGADLTGADLTGANLAGANLAGADLTGANLTGADLTDANLRWVTSTGAKGLYMLPQRSDGYPFLLVLDSTGWMIKAGCRYLSIGAYRAHTLDYNDSDKQAETLRILDYAQAILDSLGVKA